MGLMVYVAAILVIDWTQRKSEREVLAYKNTLLRRGMYVILGLLILAHSTRNETSFIYFQF